MHFLPGSSRPQSIQGPVVRAVNQSGVAFVSDVLMILPKPLSARAAISGTLKAPSRQGP